MHHLKHQAQPTILERNLERNVMQYSIAEIFELVEAEPDQETKALILRENISAALRTILMVAFDPRVRWVLPPGPMNYRPGPPTGLEHMLQHKTIYESLSLYNFDATLPPHITLQQPNMPLQKRVDLFCQLLETVDPRDAVILVAAKDKRLPYPSITPNLVAMAFPGMLFGVQAVAPQNSGSVPQVKPRAAKQPLPVPTTQEAAPAPVKRGRGRPKGSPNKKGSKKVAKKAAAQPKAAYFEEPPIIGAEPEALFLGGGEVLPHDPNEVARLLATAPVQRGQPTQSSLLQQAREEGPEELWIGGGSVAENDG